MANKRIFVSFAMEDVRFRDFLVGQARNNASPFEFVDLSVKEPWKEEWKTKCRIRIKGCDGVIALISAHTANANGQLWEIECAYEEDIPTMLMWANDSRPPLPKLIANRMVKVWSWDNLEGFISRI